MNSAYELLLVALIVFVPTVPVCLYVMLVATRGGRRERGEPGSPNEVVSGSRDLTPFVLIGLVGSFVGVVALLAVGLTLLARAAA